MNTKTTKSTWFPKEKILVSEITGDNVIKEDISLWKKELLKALNRIPKSSEFKILFNMHGFKANDFEAHKEFRIIIPLLMKEFGWKVGYLRLFEDEIHDMEFINRKNSFCVAVAHCHHDDSKMNLYNSINQNTNEKFFTDPIEAEQWIRSVAI